MRDESNLDILWNKFRQQRVAPLSQRYPGFYRGLVIETNDPLQWHRIRFKCPELHDHTLKPEELPWADRAPSLGGKNAGSWTHPIIGDVVWITFEKQHPYAPIWIGFAMGTRRKRYPLESIYTESPLAVKLDGTPDEQPSDFLREYLPKDLRPMSSGWKDRYGSSEINSSVGFFPIEHDVLPASTGTDAVAKKGFKAGFTPEANRPDKKYLCRITKYGTYDLHSDVGYYWKKPSSENGNGSSEGEFEGDFDNDRPFEIDRYKYLTKLFNENEPNSQFRDQRRYECRTRAGHKFEMRDVGWAQKAGGRVVCEDAGECKSRTDEYGEPRVLSRWTESDERWIKLRTKGGHLFQAIDTGFHPQDDEFYKRLLLEEIGPDVDGEEDAEWTKRDARQIRLVTRWGTKFVLDDRGSDGIDAEGEEKPRANGWMLKTRRSWTTEPSTPRGFAIEANDKDELNTTRWYTPKSKIIEMNDRKDYVLFCTDMKSEISREWKKLRENEFALGIGMTQNPEEDTYHLKLDKANGYIRLKTAAGGDNGRRPEPERFSSSKTGLNQGIEMRDGRQGQDGPWTELVDIDHRGFWLSRDQKLGVWRAADGSEQYVMIHDGDKTIVIRNNEEDGKVQLYCLGDVEVISKNVAFKAEEKVTFKAGQEICFEAGSSGHAKLTSSQWQMDVPDNAPRHTGFLPGAESGSGAQSDSGAPCEVLDPEPIEQEKREPEDRADTGNEPFDEVPEKVIKACED